MKKLRKNWKILKQTAWNHYQRKKWTENKSCQFKKSQLTDEESETFLFDVDANPSKASYFIAKATALKRKRNENKDEIKVLEEAVEISEKKRCKVNKWHNKISLGNGFH